MEQKTNSRKLADPPQETETEPAFDIDGVVERCWNDFIPGSPVGHVTEAHNVAHAFKIELKRRLNSLLNGAR